ncbi:Hpt domain-containing protein [Sphingobium terrigena]|uniref:Hpt domain-containing protein n=1 Tax=Sphingobium terrigena TaxID=2304063 RepID=A0A418YMH0_9SPHN|nr:Hpt domain-containing protein [Sphingobium terrigena]RJG52151.1 Hpt domain-containing protein [Sphingobium terrigena]
MTDMDHRLAQLRQRFITRCRADLAMVEADDTTAQDLQHIAHRIVGMAGTVGLNELGMAAAQLEDVLRRGDQITNARQALLSELRTITETNS